MSVFQTPQPVAAPAPAYHPARPTHIRSTSRRPEDKSVAQLQALMNNSPRVRPLQAMADQMNNYPQAACHTSFRMAADKMPRIVAQRQKIDRLFKKSVEHEAEKTISTQAKRNKAAQRKEAPRPNRTALPDALMAGVESLSGTSLDHVKVHYNSARPTQLSPAHATQRAGLRSGQRYPRRAGARAHLPHEAWHIVQQAQVRVQATRQLKDGVPINDDRGLEQEACTMGAKAWVAGTQPRSAPEQFAKVAAKGSPVQKFAPEVQAVPTAGQIIVAPPRFSVTPSHDRRGKKRVHPTEDPSCNENANSDPNDPRAQKPHRSGDSAKTFHYKKFSLTATR